MPKWCKHVNQGDPIKIILNQGGGILKEGGGAIPSGARFIPQKNAVADIMGSADDYIFPQSSSSKDTDSIQHVVQHTNTLYSEKTMPCRTGNSKIAATPHHTTVKHPMTKQPTPVPYG